MSDIIIRVENLSKSYLIGHQCQERHATLRDAITAGTKSLGSSLLHPFRNSGAGGRAANELEEFWALRDLSFEVKRGDRVGIIGRNGAGKSTLLKIISRITEPTRGRIEIEGRVASLLEVGTGFHPELTGRENVFLNGAMLGMGKAEIKRKFDEIVAFSEVEKFLDTPVKRYSSGMYVRLAFAVAAHLEPEILIVDEVLAVGDAKFQKKCLGKMGEVADEGRTILFVSHNMAAVQNLCRRGLVLANGTMQFKGSQAEAIDSYLGALGETCRLDERPDRKGTGDLRITKISFRGEGGREIDTLMSGQDVDILLHFRVEPGASIRKAIASIKFNTSMGLPVFLQHNRLTGEDFGTIAGNGIFRCRIKKLPLPAALFVMDYSIDEENRRLDALSSAIEVNVVEGKFYKSGEIPPVTHGVCLVDAEWSVLSNER